MAGYDFISPTDLYNILNDDDVNGNPSISDKNYLLLIDARPYQRYDAGHILLAQHAKRDGNNFIQPLFQKVFYNNYHTK